MSEVSAVENVYSAVEESARLMGAPCSRDKVWPILTAYGDGLAASGVVFNVTTGERHAGVLDYSIMVPAVGDPYAPALSNGFVAETDHPVGSLLSDIQEKCTISEYVVDYATHGGLNKIYAHFPQDMKGVPELADMPSMPPALGENADFFARHGLEKVAMIGIDHQHRTTNLYFQLSPESPLESNTVLSILRDIGAPEPREQLVEFAQRSFRVYVTLGWDSPKVERMSFANPPARNLDLSAIPVRIEPEIEKFLESAPHAYAGGRIQILALKWSPDGERLSFGSSYQLSPMQRKILAARGEQV